MDPCVRGRGEQGRALPGPEHRGRPGHCRQLDTSPGIESRPTDRSGHRRESLAVTAALKCHSGAFAGRASAPTPCGTARPSGQRSGFLEPSLPPENTTRTGRGRTEPAIPEQTLLFTARSLSTVLLPQPGWLRAAPSSRTPHPSPTGGWQLLNTGLPPVFAFSESFHSLFPGSSSCDFPSCCQTSPWQLLPPSFLFTPTDYGGAGISDSTKELWADPPLAGGPTRDPNPLPGAQRGISPHLPPEGPPVSCAPPWDSPWGCTEQRQTLSSKAD